MVNSAQSIQKLRHCGYSSLISKLLQNAPEEALIVSDPVGRSRPSTDGAHTAHQESFFPFMSGVAAIGHLVELPASATAGGSPLARTGRNQVPSRKPFRSRRLLRRGHVPGRSASAPRRRSATSRTLPAPPCVGHKCHGATPSDAAVEDVRRARRCLVRASATSG